jgi:N-acetylmuramoyl-L-alanine amidase
MMLKSFLATMVLIVSLFISTPALAYTVKSGDTLWKISQSNGISLAELRKANGITGDMIYVGQSLNIPSTISASDKDLLARLVRAEAQGEPYAGKVAVATVVLNRVDNADFPNSIRAVIYETYENGKYYAFSPVQNGEINKPADADSIRAVAEAINFHGQGSGSLFFYNPKTSTSKWILDREVTVVIGNHRFAK